MIKITATPSFERVGKAIMDIKIGKAIKDGIEMYAITIEGESKKLTPVDTGRLRSSISSQLQPLQAMIGPHTNYATYVHEGTSRMKGRPFMQWGMDRATKRLSDNPVFKAIEKEISTQLRKI